MRGGLASVALLAAAVLLGLFSGGTAGAAVLPSAHVHSLVDLAAASTPEPPPPAIRVLEVVKSASSLASDASGRALYDHWTAAGHRVTLWNAASAPPADLDTAYDVVWLTNSVPIATSMSAYNATTLPVLATGLRSPHSGYGTTTPKNGAVQDTVYLTGAGDPTAPADLTTATTVTVLDDPYTARYVPASQLGSGHVAVASTDQANPTRLVYTRYEAGAKMHSGYAPSKRAWFLTHPGSIGQNTRGWQFLDRLLTWAAGTPGPSDSTPPGPVADLTVTAISTSSVGLAWANPGDPDLAGIMVRRAQGSTPPASPTDGVLVADLTASDTSLTDSGLSPDTAYAYALFAHDAVPNYATPATVAARTAAGADTTAPGPVADLTVTAISTSSVGLAWANPGDPDLAGIMVRRAQGSTPPASPTDGVLVADLTASDTSLTDSGLSPDTAYAYALFAHDAVPNYATPATVAARTVATSAPSSLRILEVVKSASSLASDASGRALYDHWTAAGHRVTLWNAASAPPADLDTAYDVVWLTNSVPIATSMSAYNATTLPVLATGLRSPHSGYGTTTPKNGAVQDTVYLTGAGDPTAPADLTTATTVTVLDDPYTARYVPASQLGSGHVAVASTDQANPTRLVYTRYEAGAKMHSGYAPSKRAWFLTHPGSIGQNTRGWQFLDRLLTWAVTA